LASTSTVARVASLVLAVTSPTSGFNCASCTSTVTATTVPGSTTTMLGVTLSAAAPFRKSAVGSPLHAQDATAAPTRMAPMRRSFMFLSPDVLMNDLEADDFLNRIVAQLRRPVGYAGFRTIV